MDSITYISLVLTVIALALGGYSIVASWQQDQNLQHLKDKIGFLAQQVPHDLRILVPVDKQSSPTGEWGRSLLYGMKEYLRGRQSIFINGQAYRFIIDDPDDEGNPELAMDIAKSLLNNIEHKPFPLAVIGPISTSCADASIHLYRLAYAAKKAVHLLPVPTGTTLLSGSFEDGKTALSPCIFRLPPDNKRQARTIIKTIEALGADKDNSTVCYLTYPDSNTYISDLNAMLEKEARDRWQPGHQSFRVGERKDLLGSWLEDRVKTKYKVVVVIGAWETDGEFPCVGEFIKNWRRKEQALGIDRAVILLSDFPVPDAIQENLKGSVELDEVYATFQIKPDTLHRTSQHVPTTGAIDRALIAYGYDSLRLIDHLIQQNATTEPDRLVDALRDMPKFDGLAQVYQFSKTTNENAAAEFHVYGFSTNLLDPMPHYDRCPCES